MNLETPKDAQDLSIYIKVRLFFVYTLPAFFVSALVILFTVSITTGNVIVDIFTIGLTLITAVSLVVSWMLYDSDLHLRNFK